MNILQLVDTLEIGGTERMAVNISNVLAANGNKVILCATHGQGPLVNYVSRNVELVTFNKKNFWDVITFSKLIRLIISSKIEVIHAHSSSVVWGSLLKMVRPKIKLVWHDHYGQSDALTNNERWIYKILSVFFFGIISVNKKLEKWSQKNTLVRNDRIVVLSNFPLLLELFEKKSTNNIVKILCLANFREQKNHPNIIKAIQITKTRVKIPFKLILAGSYNPNDKYYEKVVNLINELDLANDVEILGKVERPEYLLSEANIGILGSDSEGLPVSLLEYGLAGLPVIVTSVGQCEEVVGFGKFGKIVPPKDELSLSNEIVGLIEDLEKSNKMGLEFKEHVIVNYGYQNFLSCYMKLLESYD